MLDRTRVPSEVATASLYPNADLTKRRFALWYFASLISLWTLGGHIFLGFEQAWIHPLAGALAACFTQWILELVDSRAKNRSPRYHQNLIDFFSPAIITGLACAMLLYPNERIAPILFAAVLSIASKVLFRITLPNGMKHHFLNPSNAGIVFTLFLLPWVGQAPPYQFTENVDGIFHWFIPGVILGSGLFVHAYATKRVVLCLAWIVGFITQGLFRAWLKDDNWFVPLTPMTSAAFILFTLYMVPDPATTPISRRGQVIFGLSVAAIYGVLQGSHIVFGLFLSLTITCSLRGASFALHPNRWHRGEIDARASAAARHLVSTSRVPSSSVYAPTPPVAISHGLPDQRKTIPH